MRKLMDGQGAGRPGVAGKVGRLVETIRDGGWCEEQGSLMRGLAYGILDPDGERYRLALIHRSECPACRAYVVSLRGLAAALPPVLLPWGLGAGALARAGGHAHASAIIGAGRRSRRRRPGRRRNRRCDGRLGCGRCRRGGRRRWCRRRELALGRGTARREARRRMPARPGRGGGLRGAHRSPCAPARRAARSTSAPALPGAGRRGAPTPPASRSATAGCAAGLGARAPQRRGAPRVGPLADPDVPPPGRRVSSVPSGRAASGNARPASSSGAQTLTARPASAAEAQRAVGGSVRRGVRGSCGARTPPARSSAQPAPAGTSAARARVRDRLSSIAAQPRGKTLVSRASASGLPRGRSRPRGDRAERVEAFADDVDPVLVGRAAGAGRG